MPDGQIATPEIRDAERLQGFEADWTLPGIKGEKRQGPRWKMVGNAVSVPVARWIGHQLACPARPAEYDAEPLPAGARWPRAAEGGPGRRTMSVGRSMWPIRSPRPHLADFLKHPLAPLSVKAATGSCPGPTAARSGSPMVCWTRSAPTAIGSCPTHFHWPPEVQGPGILARTITPIRQFGKKGYRAQYHQQSDRHSKVISWSILFDLLIESQLLRDHVAAGKVIAGVNHEMSDFAHGRRKNLDLVIARPGADGGPLLRTFAEIAEHYDIRLTAEEFNVLEDLPALREGPVGSVLVAVEAKATMTAHQKARPRLYDELNSSHATVRGAADQAVAAAAIMVNHAAEFLTYDLNKHGVDSTPSLVFTSHNQPHDTQIVIEKLEQLPRRAGTGTFGFDAIGIIVLDCRNDGSPVSIVSADPAPSPASDYHYDQMVRRVASHYAFRFSHI